MNIKQAIILLTLVVLSLNIKSIKVYLDSYEPVQQNSKKFTTKMYPI